MMKKQIYHPKDAGPHNISLISTLGLAQPEGTCLRAGKIWSQHQVCRGETFALVALECRQGSEHTIGYTNQENYVKVSFWLTGRHTTVLDGFGQHEHERPEVFLTCGPAEMIKVDMIEGHAHVSTVALCLLRDFFSVHMGIAPEELPEPLRTMVLPDEKPYGFHSLPLTPDFAVATRAILSAPFAVRSDPVYAQAKAVELMCLLINRLSSGHGSTRLAREGRRRESRLYEARDLLTLHYAQDITLDRVSRQVGLNKMALTSGFRQLFGMSVYDFLQKERMQHAYALLQDESYTIAKIAEAVGYSHSCNFSTAFRAHFGCSPQKARVGQR